MFFHSKPFFCFTGSGIHMNAESHSLENCLAKILVLESESESEKVKKNFWIRIRKK
jgi:hypothetical protein